MFKIFWGNRSAGPVLTRGRISFVELEVPLLTRGLISFVELEVPLVLTRGLVSQTYLQTPGNEGFYSGNTGLSAHTGGDIDVR